MRFPRSSRVDTVAHRVVELRSDIAKREQRKGAADARWKPCEEDKVSSPHPKPRTRAAVAAEQRVSERKIRAQSPLTCVGARPYNSTVVRHE
jgi:hypothetical protein